MHVARVTILPIRGDTNNVTNYTSPNYTSNIQRTRANKTPNYNRFSHLKLVFNIQHFAIRTNIVKPYAEHR